MKISIRKLLRKEIDDAIPLVWDVFNKYEAVHYPETGKKHFTRQFARRIILIC